MEHLKKIKQIGVGLVALLVALPLAAADLTRGVTFTDGQRVTAAGLHNLVDSASVSVAFLTGKDLLSTVDSTDYVLVYDTSTGTFKKMTLSVLLTGNTDLITAQPNEPSPAANDYLLLYDASGGAFAKVSVTNLITGSTNLILAQATITNLLSTAEFLVSNGGTNNRISLANLWASNFQYTRAFTNQLQHTSPTNTDGLLIWDRAAGTNKWTTLVGLVTNLPAVVNPTNSGFLMLATVSGEVQKVPLTQFVMTNDYVFSFSSTATNLNGLGAGKNIDTAHGLGTTPRQVRGVLANTSPDLGYAIGDELDFAQAGYSTGVFVDAALIAGANSTNVFAVQTVASSALVITHKTTGARAAMDQTKWTMRVTAIR